MRRSYQISCVVLCAFMAGMAGQARAALLDGTSVTGSLTFGGSNLFDGTTLSSPFYIPPADLNASGTSVTIDSTNVEFGVAIGSATDSVDFTDNTLTINENLTTGFSGAVYTFTDTAFAGLTLNTITDTFGKGGITGGIVGDTLSLNAPFNGGTGGFASFTFSVATTTTGSGGGSAAPLPNSFVAGMLCLIGLLGWYAWPKRNAAALK